MSHLPPDAPRRDDLRLIQGSLRGRPRAIDVLVERLDCVPRILVSLNQRLGSRLTRDDLADLSQDVLVVVWGKLGTFEGRARLETWVYRICYLELLNRIRALGRLARTNGTSLDDVVDSVAAPGQASPLDYEAIEQGLAELGPPEEDIIRMKHHEQRTFTDIGRILDLAPSTAKTHYYRGMAWLRQRLTAVLREESR